MTVLNQDGTPATDAKATAIKTIGIGMPVVNTHLELIPRNSRGQQADLTSMTKLKNGNGTVAANFIDA